MASAPKRVVLAGWYGAVNVGDELLLATLAQWVRDDGNVPLALSANPAYTRSTRGIESASFSDFAATLELLASADVFVLGGGGLLQDYDVLDAAAMTQFPAAGATLYAQLFGMAADLGLTTVALAQGLGPLRTDAAKSIAADVFGRADHVSVRDTQSLALLRSIGIERDVTVAPDPVWSTALDAHAMDLVTRHPQLVGKKILAINLRQWPFVAHWEEPLAQALATALPPGWAGLWVDFQRTPKADHTGFADDEIATRMIARLRGDAVHIRFDASNVNEAAAAISASDALLAMRLHAVLLGHRAGLPVVTIEYDAKVAALNVDLGVPAAQRMGVVEAPTCLHRALAQMTTPGVEPFILPADVAATQAQASVAHRAVLRAAMAKPQSRALDVQRENSSVLARLVEHDPGYGHAVAAALQRRGRWPNVHQGSMARAGP